MPALRAARPAALTQYRVRGPSIVPWTSPASRKIRRCPETVDCAKGNSATRSPVTQASRAASSRTILTRAGWPSALAIAAIVSSPGAGASVRRTRVGVLAWVTCRLGRSGPDECGGRWVEGGPAPARPGDKRGTAPGEPGVRYAVGSRSDQASPGGAPAHPRGRRRHLRRSGDRSQARHARPHGCCNRGSSMPLPLKSAIGDRRSASHCRRRATRDLRHLFAARGARSRVESQAPGGGQVESPGGEAGSEHHDGVPSQ